MAGTPSPHVVVTGAGGGIGRALCLDLAALGSAVTCLDLDMARAEETARSVEQAGGRATALGCDVAASDAVEASAEEAESRLGEVTGLVLGAGGARGANERFLDLSDVRWNTILGANLTGVFHCVRSYARRMAARGGGSIVVITSNAAHVAVPGLAHYSAAKGGATALVRSVAAELAPTGVRVNAVAPGVIRAAANAVRLDDPAEAAALLARVPMGRAGTPHEVSGAVAYLLGDGAAYTTGTTIHVDGGFTCL